MAVSANTDSNESQLIIDYPMGDKIALWSEYKPSLYKLSVNLKGFKRGNARFQVGRLWYAGI
jgi:hypothetical protein